MKDPTDGEAIAGVFEWGLRYCKETGRLEGRVTGPSRGVWWWLASSWLVSSLPGGWQPARRGQARPGHGAERPDALPEH